MVVIGLILLVAVTALVVQNQGPVLVQFFGWQYQTQLGLALIAAAVVGALIVYLAAAVRHRELHGRLRDVEARLRTAEVKPPVAEEPARASQH